MLLNSKLFHSYSSIFTSIKCELFKRFEDMSFYVLCNFQFFIRPYAQQFLSLQLYLWESYSFFIWSWSERYNHHPFLLITYYHAHTLNFHFLLQGITTYEYVVAMRTLTEPPGPSVDAGEQQSLPSSPTGSSVTAISGRSSVGMSLQIKGAWCTPPRIFMDQQVLPYLYNWLNYMIRNFVLKWITYLHYK
jgi:hypothetical protein